MPHQCVRCSRIIPLGSRELLEGCNSCKSKFFFYVREEKLEELKNKIIEIPEQDKIKIEKDIRQIAGIEEEDSPVILDFESVRSIGDGKFEIDLSKLFDRKSPLVFKVAEGKYLIDLSKMNSKSFKKEEKL